MMQARGFHMRNPKLPASVLRAVHKSAPGTPRVLESPLGIIARAFLTSSAFRNLA